MAPYLSDEKRLKVPVLRELLIRGREMGVTYMLWLKNTVTDEEFHLYLEKDTTPRQAFAAYVAAHGATFDPVECYDMSKDLNSQLQENRAYHWDKDLPVFTGPFTAVFPAD